MAVTDVLEDGCGCREATLGSVGLWWVGLVHGMCPWGVELREQGPPVGNTLLQGQSGTLIKEKI